MRCRLAARRLTGAGTIFAYGQTGTGKTHTMQGNTAVPEERGIIPNSFAHIFGHIAKSTGATQSGSGPAALRHVCRFLVHVSYLEIYCESVRDVGVYVKDLSTVMVKCADDMDKIMTTGNSHRAPRHRSHIPHAAQARRAKPA